MFARLIRPWLLASLVVLLPFPARAAVRVVTTLPGLAALTKEIGGDRVAVKALTRSTQDPHFVDPKPSLALDLNRAELLIVAGLDLEVGWLPTLILGARNAKIHSGAPGHLDASQLVRVLDRPSQVLDRSHGDVHPGGNPHYLNDPRAAAAVAKGIAARLQSLDANNAAAYQRGLDTLLASLQALQSKWEKRLAAARGVPILQYHKTWTYLADWLGLKEVGFVEPKPGIPPNPAHIARLIDSGRKGGVKLILQEEHYPDKTSRLVADKIPCGLLRVRGDVNFEQGETYPQRMERLLTTLEGALGAAPKGP
jgi:zinc/manganese transport system substrate-binding protein